MPKFVPLLPVPQGCASFLHMLERHVQSLSLTDPGGLFGEPVMGRGEVRCLEHWGLTRGYLVGQLRGSALPDTEGLEAWKFGFYSKDNGKLLGDYGE